MPSFTAPIRPTNTSLLDFVLRPFCWLVILAPLIFFVLMVQYSAILFPFWDHCEMIKYFVKIHDHTLQARDLWAPHNHSRPLVLRALVLTSGLLTQWDVGSEFTYLIGSVILAFILQALCLRKLCGARSMRFLALAALLSIFSFSPSGHDNHWWSFMLQLNLTHLFLVFAFITLCFNPAKWNSNITAALACWLATYTLSNGLVAFLAAAVTVQLAKKPLLRFDRVTFFWVANCIVAAVIYIPGLAESGGTLKPLKLLKFCLAYLGSPVSALFVFPFRSMFDVPNITVRNAWVGALLLVIGIALFRLLRKRSDISQPSTLLFICFSVFAIGSGLLTAHGRAEFDSLGLANANASRYTIFGSYLVYGLLYGVSELVPPHWLQGRQLLALGAVFLGFAANSYAKSVTLVYRDSHNFNQLLASAFWGNNPANHKYIYPNAPVLENMLIDLKRLQIGPYRFIHPDK